MVYLSNDRRKEFSESLKKICSADDVLDLFTSKTWTQFIRKLREVIGLTERDRGHIWMNTIYTWKTGDLEEVFNKSELLFFRELLTRDGVLTSSDLAKLIPTHATKSEIVKELEDSYIFTFKGMSGTEEGRHLYVLHPKIIAEARNAKTN